MRARFRVANARNKIRGRVRAFAETHQCLGEILVGVHGNMAGDVVENVGFGKIVELVGTANGDGGGKGAIPEAIKKHERRNVAADRFGLKSGERSKKSIDVV